MEGQYIECIGKCHFGGLNGTYTYMLFGPVEFNLAKASLFLSLYNSNFSLAKFCPERTFTTQVYPSNFNLEKLG
jgi:hypothetical protein